MPYVKYSGRAANLKERGQLIARAEVLFPEEASLTVPTVSLTHTGDGYEVVIQRYT